MQTVMTFAAAMEVAKNIPLDSVNYDNLKVNLTEAEIEFPGNLGRTKLMAKALEHGVAIPLTDGTNYGEDAPETGTVAEAEAEGAEGEQKKSRNVVPEKYRKKYGATQSNNDDVAQALAAATKNKDGTTNEEALAAIAAANGIDIAKYASLNIGMKRMNVGNVLRGKAKKGERVVIGEKVWEAEDKSADNGKTAAKL